MQGHLCLRAQHTALSKQVILCYRWRDGLVPGPTYLRVLTRFPPCRVCLPTFSPCSGSDCWLEAGIWARELLGGHSQPLTCPALFALWTLTQPPGMPFPLLAGVSCSLTASLQVRPLGHPPTLLMVTTPSP